MSNRKRIIWAVILIVALNIALGLADEFLPSGRVTGPAGSSFVTDADGTGAWRELLIRSGSSAPQITQPLGEYQLDPETTLIINDIAFASEEEIEPVVTFVEEGGHLVLAIGPSQRSDFWDAMHVETNGHVESGNRYTPRAPTHSTLTNVSEVTASNGMAFDHPHGLELLSSTDGVLAYEEVVGRGTVLLVADSSVFSNANLAETDNAAFAVQVTKGRSVVFNEFGHGFTDDDLPDPVLPRSWATTMYLLGASLVLFLLAIGRRFGPPEYATRTLHPPRALFVESLATTLSRTPVSDAAEPVREEAIRRAYRKAGLAPHAPYTELVELAPSLGIDPDDLQSIEHAIGDDEAALAAGRVLAAASNNATRPISTNVAELVKGNQ